ncbi:MAG TPA: hypothetical protein PKE03_10315 [Bacteroidales bacterium]|nr:hypothetical protein [Bacteroidales bacterium]
MSLAQTQICWSDDQFAIYLSPSVQSHHVFDAMLEKLERADEMIISSFATNEQYIRRIIRNRPRIGHITLILDFTVASRNPGNTDFASMNVDELLLTSNHSKLIYMRRDSAEMIALMSNNATNNQRYEAGIIVCNHQIITLYKQRINQLKQLCIRW